MALLFFVVFLMMAAVAGGWAVFATFRSGYDIPDTPAVSAPSLKSPIQLTQAQVREMIKEQDLVNAAKNVFLADTPNGFVQVVTFLDVGLTGFLNARVDHLKTLTRGKPEQIAIVVMDGYQGHILAMAGFDLETATQIPVPKPCIRQPVFSKLSQPLLPWIR